MTKDGAPGDRPRVSLVADRYASSYSSSFFLVCIFMMMIYTSARGVFSVCLLPCVRIIRGFLVCFFFWLRGRKKKADYEGLSVPISSRKKIFLKENCLLQSIIKKEDFSYYTRGEIAFQYHSSRFIDR